MRAKVNVVLFILLLSALSRAWSATYTSNYYVDSIGGDDTADGLTAATPWKSLANIQAISPSLSAWTSIHLRRGSSWTGAAAFLHIDVPNVQITDYDIGDPPRIDGRVALDPAGFTLIAGTLHTYQYPFVGLVTGAEQHNIWEDGVRLVRAASQAAVENTPGSYYVPPESAWTKDVATNVYLHPSSDDDPSSNDRSYLTQGVVWAICLGSESNEGASLLNIEAMGGCHHNGNVQLGRNSSASGVTTRWGTIHALYVDSGILVDCLSLDCEQGFDFVANKGSSTDGSIEMDHCVADIDQTADIIAGPAFFTHGDTMLTVRYLSCTSRAHAIGFGINGCPSGQTVLIQDCQVFEASANPVQIFHAYDLNNGGVSPSNSAAITMTNNLADGYGFYLYGYGWNQYTTCTIDQARFVARAAQPAIEFQCATVEVKNSSFYAPGTVGYSGLELVNPCTCNWHNNIVDGFGMGTEQFSTPTYIANDNVWHLSGGTTPPMRAAGTYYGTFSAYGSVWDLTSVNTDPLWVEAPSLHDNFTLQSSSPAIAISAGYPAYSAGTTGGPTTSGGSGSSTSAGTSTSTGNSSASTTSGAGAQTPFQSNGQCGLGSVLGCIALFGVAVAMRRRTYWHKLP